MYLHRCTQIRGRGANRINLSFVYFSLVYIKLVIIFFILISYFDLFGERGEFDAVHVIVELLSPLHKRRKRRAKKEE